MHLSGEQTMSIESARASGSIEDEAEFRIVTWQGAHLRTCETDDVFRAISRFPRGLGSDGSERQSINVSVTVSILRGLRNIGVPD